MKPACKHAHEQTNQNEVRGGMITFDAILLELHDEHSPQGWDAQLWWQVGSPTNQWPTPKYPPRHITNQLTRLTNWQTPLPPFKTSWTAKHKHPFLLDGLKNFCSDHFHPHLSSKSHCDLNGLFIPTLWGYVLDNWLKSRVWGLLIGGPLFWVSASRICVNVLNVHTVIAAVLSLQILLPWMIFIWMYLYCVENGFCGYGCQVELPPKKHCL